MLHNPRRLFRQALRSSPFCYCPSWHLAAAILRAVYALAVMTSCSSGRIGLEISIELHTQCVEHRRDEAVLSYREDDIHELLSSVTLRQRRPCGLITLGVV